MKFIVITLLATFIITCLGFSKSKNNILENGENSFFNTPNNPKELGNVNWNRDYDEAIKLVESKNKPVLILFQEIPGCKTCVSYGEQVLTNPLIVDAIEELFIPVAIYNNRDGSDLKTLKKFNEPAWNNPVIRIVDQDGKDAAERVNGDYSLKGITSAMIEALKKTKKVIPKYLRLLNQETISRSHELKTVTFSMYCFWKGEAILGKLNGVISTIPGLCKWKRKR